MTENGVNKVMNQIESSNLKDQKVLVVYEPDIHESVAGIIAGRVKDKYYKPTIIFTNSTKIIFLKDQVGQLRNMICFKKYLVSKILVKFGGHPMAAGLSIEKSNFQSFRDGLKQANYFNR